MTYLTAGLMTFQWDDDRPLVFTISQECGAEDARFTRIYDVDLTSLEGHYSYDFLLAYKDILIEASYRIVLTTLSTYHRNISSLFSKVAATGNLPHHQKEIDRDFLLVLASITDDMSHVATDSLRNFFRTYPHSPLFAREIIIDHFPIKTHKKGNFGRQVDRVLKSSLSTNQCIDVLKKCNDLYETGEIDIGLYSHMWLAFSLYLRPESYRQILISDLESSTTTKDYFVRICPVKSGVNKPQKITYRVSENVWSLLQKQRQAVIAKFGNIVSSEDIGKLALFPAQKMVTDGIGWFHAYPNTHYGQLETSSSFVSSYGKPINKKLATDIKINARRLRHTIGTRMAKLGCSATSIMAVLKHVTDSTARIYVDITFHGWDEKLGQSIKPSFEQHLPSVIKMRSKNVPVAVDKAIYSDDVDTGETILTGECGRTLKCQFAPFTCYDCDKFIPCFDVDHSLNLKVIELEISDYKKMGTPYQVMVEKAERIKIRIMLIIAVCDRFLDTQSRS
ncbi:phage integrase family protein [Herbaspirillum sp. CF444]|uniref:site-specific integrase n=1 Tax=Herbaspirillum sp. CF444 TaxID=1144319 RepID=UPI0002726E74|nr:site-specific integrase [Herbaspirillum sp. CF444]EJL88526.1 phage integrase family protein [Herbaspirillum sp. CF444]